MSEKNPILYVDFDGVLQPDDVFLREGLPTLMGDQAHLGLFVWMPILENILMDFPEVKIRLSTSWVSVKGYDYTKQRLSPFLQERVIGSTFHNEIRHEYGRQNRYQQILDDVIRQGHRNWVALDNDDFGWPDICRDYLVKTNDDLGLGEPTAQVDLIRKLKLICDEQE